MQSNSKGNGPTSPRLRLLGLVQTDSSPSHLQHGRPLRVISGDDVYFEDNIPCKAACPAGTDVPTYIAAIADGKFDEAFAVNRAANLFPSLLCHICSRPCEAACRRRLIDEPVAIRDLKRAAAEHGSLRVSKLRPAARSTEKRVAVVGSGPAGLAAALDLRERGHSVKIYEGAEQPGGMLRLAIPPFRLPREVLVRQIRMLEAAGVEFILKTEVGKDLPLASLLEESDAVLLALGCARSAGLKVPGADLPGVHSGLEFMRQVALGQKVDIGPRVVVVGAGLVGMDCARSALRLGARAVMACDLLGEEEMTYDPIERLIAISEGTIVHFRAGPKAIIGQERVEAVEMVRFGGGNGAPRTPIAGSEWTYPADSVIIAIGQSPEIASMRDGTGVMVDERGRLVRDALSYQAGSPKLFAAGDVCSGPSSVIQAIADGRKAAASIDAFLMSEGHVKPDARKRDLFNWTLHRHEQRRRRQDEYDSVRRQPVTYLPLPDKDGLEQESEVGYSPLLASREAQRCLQCQLNIFHTPSRCIACGRCAEVCPYRALSWVDTRRLDSLDGSKEAVALQESRQWQEGAALLIDDDRCIRCGLCTGICPTQALDLQPFWLRHTVARHREAEPALAVR